MVYQVKRKKETTENYEAHAGTVPRIALSEATSTASSDRRADRGITVVGQVWRGGSRRGHGRARLRLLHRRERRRSSRGHRLVLQQKARQAWRGEEQLVAG